MKIIEALKELKSLEKKHNDLVSKLKRNSAHLDIQPSEYPDPEAKIREWVAAATATSRRTEELTLAIQRTNLATEVTIAWPDISGLVSSAT